MSSFSYYLLWLAAGLVVVAAISAGIARHLRLRMDRQLKALQLLDALAYYSDWVAAQGQTPFFQGNACEADSLLQQVRAIGQHWFPELLNETAELFAVHALLVDFMRTQQMLRVSDPEAWLESDFDRQFMSLWRLHVRAINATVKKLRPMADQGQMPGKTFAV